jgi:hypothetical protein
MSAVGWGIVGACAATLVWLMVCAWLVDVITAQRKALADAQLAIRLYRDTRNEADTQVRALLVQNERLALKIIDLASDTMPSLAAEALASPPSTTFPRRES